jgi:hypothetical protein
VDYGFNLIRIKSPFSPNPILPIFIFNKIVPFLSGRFSYTVPVMNLSRPFHRTSKVEKDELEAKRKKIEKESTK